MERKHPVLIDSELQEATRIRRVMDNMINAAKFDPDLSDRARTRLMAKAVLLARGDMQELRANQAELVVSM
jgi:hypothetical protein